MGIIICFVVVLLLLCLAARFMGKYHDHQRKLHAQRHHVEWVLNELNRQREDPDA